MFLRRPTCVDVRCVFIAYYLFSYTNTELIPLLIISNAVFTVIRQTQVISYPCRVLSVSSAFKTESRFRIQTWNETRHQSYHTAGACTRRQSCRRQTGVFFFRAVFENSIQRQTCITTVLVNYCVLWCSTSSNYYSIYVSLAQRKYHVTRLYGVFRTKVLMYLIYISSTTRVFILYNLLPN